MAWATWRDATQDALYGPHGFFLRERPVDHFRTSAHTSRQFAEAIARLAELTGARTLIDIGAGQGELLTDVARCRPELELVGVEVSSRPPDLPAAVQWTAGLPDALRDVLVIANEWLDNVPLDVVEVDARRVPRCVEVDPVSGAERLGPPPHEPAARWLQRWWPLDCAPPGTRAEIGASRDSAWAAVISKIRRGVAIAADYCHDRESRPGAGTLTGYRHGLVVAPVPDGSCDITAHVALDACAAAGVTAGVSDTLLTTQRHVLRLLGVDPTLPPRDLAHADPVAYLSALGRTSEAAELLDAAGLGGFGWLVQAVGTPLPPVLTTSPRS